MKKGSALLALLTPGKGKMVEEDDEESEPKSRKNPLMSEDEDEGEDMGDDAEGEEAAQAFLDAIEAKDAKGLLEAFSHLQAVC